MSKSMTRNDALTQWKTLTREAEAIARACVRSVLRDDFEAAKRWAAEYQESAANAEALFAFIREMDR